MRTLMTALFVSLPAAAQAMEMYGSGPGNCGSCYGGLLTGAVYAGVAALGYWVLLQAVKETCTCTKRIGNVTGSALVVVGLLGLLCSVVGHVKDSILSSCNGPGPAMMSPGQPQGIDPGMGMMPPGQHAAGDEPAPAPKKAARPQ